jgi:hypothetical protein
MVHRNGDDEPEPEITIGLLIFACLVILISVVV